MPVKQHPSFKRPPILTPLWRYTDLAKFVDLLTSQKLWLTNAEILASEDPYEGSPANIRFPHRSWSSIEELPQGIWEKIQRLYDRNNEREPKETFDIWFGIQEQICIIEQNSRRQYFINCWHAADHESVAMWKIYGSPGAGVAVVTNANRLEDALSENSESLYLGEIDYRSSDLITIGASNAFDKLMQKRINYSYEREVRLMFWDTEDAHDPLLGAVWNTERKRFDNVVEETRPPAAGILLKIDVEALVERVLISPFAPAWYLPMIERLKEQLGFRFPVVESKVLSPPKVIP